MKLGFICLDLPGHLNPMTALARQLQARNHEVVFLYSSGAAGLPFVPGPEKDHINENLPEVSKKQGQDALEFSVRAVLAQTEAILKSLPPTRPIERMRAHSRKQPPRPTDFHSRLT
jgi:zeaxanthin glucosyltransferase